MVTDIKQEDSPTGAIVDSGGLGKARIRLRAMKEAGEASERLDPIERSKRKPKSLRLAVSAKCWECAGGGQDGAGHTRETIRTCTVNCPLHNQRPYK